jgi:hypothetical protein
MYREGKAIICCPRDLPFLVSFYQMDGFSLNLKNVLLKITAQTLVKEVKQSRYTPWRRLGGEEE